MQWFFLIALVLLVTWQVMLVMGRLRTMRSGQRSGESAKKQTARQKLERHQVGGEPENPIEIASPSVIEPQIAGLPCLKCGFQHRLLEHVALTINGLRLRKAVAQCRNCSNRRVLYFRLRPTLH